MEVTMTHFRNFTAFVCTIFLSAFSLMSCLAPTGIEVSGKVKYVDKWNTIPRNEGHTLSSTIRTVAEWQTAMEWVNTLSSEIIAGTSGNGGVPSAAMVSFAPAASSVPAASSSEQADPLLFTLVIAGGVQITIPNSGTAQNPLLANEGVTLIVKGESGFLSRLTLGSNGSLFTISENQKLILEKLELKGRIGNTGPLVKVTGGYLEMGDGTAIIDNLRTGSSEGGGVYINDGELVLLAGAKISGNSAQKGGGVYACNGSVLTIAGTIGGDAGIVGESNIANISGTVQNCGGGGAYLSGSSITMKSSAVIKGNKVGSNDSSGSYSYSGGGGVYLYNTSSMVMEDGALLSMNKVDIIGSYATRSGGGGAYVSNNSSLRIYGAARIESSEIRVWHGRADTLYWNAGYAVYGAITSYNDNIPPSYSYFGVHGSHGYHQDLDAIGGGGVICGTGGINTDYLESLNYGGSGIYRGP
jgi:hypothetical protein